MTGACLPKLTVLCHWAGWANFQLPIPIDAALEALVPVAKLLRADSNNYSTFQLLLMQELWNPDLKHVVRPGVAPGGWSSSALLP